MIDESEVGRCWEGNAEAWTAMVRAGADVCRDYANTPAFMELLGDVEGLRGLDVGCGEGHNSRLLARAGAKMSAVDIAPIFIRHAMAAEVEGPDAGLGIDYHVSQAQSLPFPDASFDFATAFMSMMDMADPAAAMAEVLRVLRPGGVFQFSILHPCFCTRLRKWVFRDGERIGVICGDYFREADGEIEVWTFGMAPAELKQRYEKFRSPVFYHTLSWWMNTLIGTGFAIDRLCEPTVSERTAREIPYTADFRIAPNYIQFRCRKGE